LSDIDTDFPPNKIEDVKNYIFNRAGLYCCDIITFNTIADKGAITDIGRALNIPLSEVRTISNSVDYENEYAQMREKYPELFKYVDIVKGVVVSIGSHPCGVVTSPFPVDTEFGLCSTSTDSHPISQIYMKEIDGLNYVKLDLLKLDTIRLISDTCKSIGIPMLTPDNVDVNDDAVWEDMKNDTTCIFQWESSTAAHYLKQLMSDDNMKKFKEIQPNIDRMTLLSIGNSAIRPAGASYRDDLANGVIRTTGSKPLDDFLKPTFGYLVFQCQIIDFLHQYCNFTMGEADVVRRCVEEHTWLYKPDGTYMYIMDAKKGDEILSYNLESKRLVYRKIEAVYKNGINYNMYEIVTDARHGIRASGDHMILTPCGWLTVQELRIGDRIIGVKGFEIITNIVDIGFRRVYDLEVQGTHTYVAGGIVVHNCFAKKTGTEQAIPVIKNGGYLMDKDGNLKKNHYIDGFVKTMVDKYNMPEEEANKTIVAFLKVIEDASNYLFSLNHSQPYSYEGYVCGWLRHYYPIQFLTCALNINKDNLEKTNAITAFANKHDIHIY
jgi:DNA polymerase III alpha subunit